MRIFILWILLIGFESVHAVTFEEANQMLHAGNTSAAASAYEQLIAQGGKSSALYANLGRALQQQGKIAEASLNYYRALVLNPRRKEALQGLVELSEKTGLQLLTSRWYAPIIEKISPFSLLIIGECLLWSGAFFLVAMAFRNRRQISALVLSICVLFLGAFLLGIGWWGDPRIVDATLAVVTAAQSESMLSQPAGTSSPVALLPPGSPVMVLSERGDWDYCVLPNGTKGWIASSSLSFVNPDHIPDRS